MTVPPRADWRHFVYVVLGVLILCGTFAMSAGCSIFRSAVAPHVQVTRLCADFANRNAAITCVKAGYTVIRDTARVVDQRYQAGALSKATAEDVKGLLDQAFFATEIADLAVSNGDYGEANTRMTVVIGLLTAIEEKLK